LDGADDGFDASSGEALRDPRAGLAQRLRWADGWVVPRLVLAAATQEWRTDQGVCLMSVPGTESAGDAERAAAAPGTVVPGDDPRVPWHGKPRASDILGWLGIVLSGLPYWALLPLRVSLIGTHPVVAELLNGSIEAIISAAAFARTGHGTLAVVLLPAIPGLMKFDLLYWWAGRLWGDRFTIQSAEVVL
jgi:hypothetical protein